MAWKQHQVKDFAKQIRNQYGKAWDFFVPDVQGAVVANQVLSVVLGQDAEAVKVAEVQQLFADLCKAMGVTL